MLVTEVPVATTDNVVFVVLKTGRVALERLVRRDHTLTVETSGRTKRNELSSKSLINSNMTVKTV